MRKKILIALASAGTVLLTVGGVFGYNQISAAETVALRVENHTIADTTAIINESKAQIDALTALITTAEKLLTTTEGQTASETERDAVNAHVAKATKQISSTTKTWTTLVKLKKSVESQHLTQFTWPWDIDTRTAQLKKATAPADLEKITTELDSAITALKTAHEQWIAEQAAKKAAEEAAKRIAATRRIRSTSTITSTGGVTAPSAPAPPANPDVPAQLTFTTVEEYVAALAPNSYISWVDHLCDGYYVCGRAWVGGSNTTPVKIELDSLLRDIYANKYGISVLVHESAHARQWFTYGSNIITANEAFTGIVGKGAVEYMADCATIVKLGYSTGTYTSTCTPDQLTAAAILWQ